MQKKTTQRNAPDAGQRQKKDQKKGLKKTKAPTTGDHHQADEGNSKKRFDVDDNPGETRRKIPQMQSPDKLLNH